MTTTTEENIYIRNIGNRTLKVEIPADEIASRAKEMADREVYLIGLEEKKKDQNAVINGQIKEARIEIRELAVAVSTGEEDGLVEVELHYDWDENIVTSKRVDNGAELGTRDIEANERQMYMEGYEGEQFESDDESETDEGTEAA